MVMTQYVKLLWDFYGKDSKKTSEHHLIHLIDFLKSNDISCEESGIDNTSEDQFSTFIVINMIKINIIKDNLKPNRAFLHGHK
tara:strand:- start:94 stop:342 length:249 start_codon:yes stop_codon:yes gene_type:complete